MPGGVAASPRMKLEPGVSFLREVVTEWRKDNALSLGAALAFYALFSLAPLLLLIIAIVGLVFGRAAAQGEIVARVGGAVGPEAAKVIEGMIARASAPASGVIATVASLATMLFGAAVTALLFTLGKTLIALYLGRTGRASVYGAAASLVVLLLWVYYSAQILLVGAEFTEVYSRRYGSRREQ